LLSTGKAKMRSPSFELEIAKCPDVDSRYLTSGNDDYLVHVQARDMEDYERIQAASVADAWHGAAAIQLCHAQHRSTEHFACRAW
jgi:DNA-binding Lrp family transcriptional regulator